MYRLHEELARERGADARHRAEMGRRSEAASRDAESHRPRHRIRRPSRHARLAPASR
jgi:hypothetical protein